MWWQHVPLMAEARPLLQFGKQRMARGSDWGRREGRDTSAFSRHPLRVQTRVNPQWRFNGLEDCNPPMSKLSVCVRVCVFEITLEHLSSILHGNSWWMDDGFITAQWALGLILWVAEGEIETSLCIRDHSLDSAVWSASIHFAFLFQHQVRQSAALQTSMRPKRWCTQPPKEQKEKNRKMLDFTLLRVKPFIHQLILGWTGNASVYALCRPKRTKKKNLEQVEHRWSMWELC